MALDSNTKQWWALSGSLTAILASGLWIYFTQFAAPKFNTALHQAVGQVMAEQTARVLPKGQIALVSIPTGKLPELQCQIDTFRKTLKRLGPIEIKQHIVLDPEGQDKYGVGAGLSARRFLRLAKKCEKLDALVSFVGAPHLSDEDLAQLGRKPVFIAESRSAEKLKKLFEQNVLQVAVVSRFEFPAPDIRNPRAPMEWFEKRYQVVTAENAGALP